MAKHVLQKRNLFQILVTQTDRHPIRNKVNHVVWLPSCRNQGYSQYLEAQVASVIFVYLLTNHIADYIKEEGGNGDHEPEE